VRDHPAAGEKLVIWVGSSKRDLLSFPAAVVRNVGATLSAAQFGDTPSAAKIWKGLGAGVLEIAEDFDRSTYRAVYTVRFRRATHVLHCFQKKSPSGVRTAKHDIELIEKRLRAARGDYEERYGKGAK
jgi:phage-related protein